MIYVLSGGGSGATLTVTSTGAGTVTVSNATLGKSYSKPVTAGGTVTFKGLKSGTWTVKLSNGTQTTTQTITINADYSMSVSYFSATISITYPAKSTCVVKNSSGTTVARNTNTGSSAKTWTATVTEAGTYTVTATATDGSGKTKSTTVSITTDGQSKSSVLNYELVLFDNGDIPALTGGWQSSGSGGSASATTTIDLYVKDETGYIKNRVLVTKNSIDLSGYTTLYANVRTVSGACAMKVGDSVATKQITATGTSLVDVSGVASAQTIGFEITARSSESQLVVTKVWLE